MWAAVLAQLNGIFITGGGSNIIAGMYDETYTIWGCEDSDVGVLLFINGVKIVLDRKIKSIHYPHEGKERMTLTKEEVDKIISEKRMYMYSKYKLEELKIWLLWSVRLHHQC